MIITLTGANFSGEIGVANIGTISSLGQPYNVTVTCATAGATITITASGMTTVTSTSGSATMSNIPYGTVATYTVSASGYRTVSGTVTSTRTIPVTLTATSGGGVVTPTMYTFTINPTPTTAIVTLTASGYSQSGNSIEVPANTVVTWKVSASGYTEQNGTHTVTKTESKSVALSEVVNPDEPSTGEYWVSEQLVDTKVGSGTPTSMLNTQYFYITDEAYLSILRNKPIKSIAVGTGQKAASGSVILSLVPLSDTKPASWEDVATIPINNTDTTLNTVMILDLTETVTVPNGYTIGYRATKGNIFGGGTVNGTYKRDEYYYNNNTAETSTKIVMAPMDFKVEG